MRKRKCGRCRMCCETSAIVDDCDDALRTFIHDLFSFRIAPDDPRTRICLKCFQTMKDFHRFYKSVRRNQSTLNGEAAAGSSKRAEPDEGEWPDADDGDGDSDFDPGAKKPKVEALDGEKAEAEEEPPQGPATLSDLFKSPNAEILRKGRFLLKSTDLDKMANTFFVFPCEECDPPKKFSAYSSMLTHFKNFHKNKRAVVICCKKKFYDKQLLYQHMAWHINPSEFQCALCNKPHTDYKSLKLHSKLHRNDESQLAGTAKRTLTIEGKVTKECTIDEYICDHCNKSYPDKRGIAQHVYVHEEKTHKCEHCSKMFHKAMTLTEHILRKHSTGTFMCNECGKTFGLEKSLKLHAVVHTKERIQCHVCSIVLKGEHAFAKHMKTHGSEWFNCDQCNYSTVWKYRLAHHKRVHHEKIKPHICEICGKAFSLKRLHQDHVNAIHLGIHKYKCRYCPETFPFSPAMSIHQNKVHKEEHEEYKAKKLREKLMAE